MNVDETRFQTSTPWLGLEKLAGYGASSASFEDGDLAFFDFLTRGLAAGELAETETPSSEAALGLLEPFAPEPEPLGKAQVKSGEQLLKATIQVVQAADEVSRKKVGEVLEMLESDLTADDVRFLDQVVVNGLAYPGGIPFQQFMPVGTGGKPDFSGLKASAAFAETLSQAYKQGKALRVALDDHSAVILRFAGGKVSAEFLTQDAAMASYLKSSMDELRQRLADKNLPVADLLYREQRHSQQQQDNANKDDEENNTHSNPS